MLLPILMGVRSVGGLDVQLNRGIVSCGTSLHSGHIFGKVVSILESPAKARS